jgi:hypothetical protein
MSNTEAVPIANKMNMFMIYAIHSADGDGGGTQYAHDLEGDRPLPTEMTTHSPRPSI